MKIVICNVPLRAENLKTTYPPLGALAVIQSLQSAGYDVTFYDINVFRPSDEEIRNYFKVNKFDIVGISATVSTSYKFVKEISSLIKSVLPESIIVVGGALTFSAEIILRFTNVDFCVIGEGEKIIVNLVNYIVLHGRHKSEDELKKIRGICFIDLRGGVVFTGYERQISIDEIQDPDYNIIEKFSRIDSYIIDPSFYEQFKYDKRAFEEHRKGKKLATVISSRGCVNHCTFCHRWQRGIRIFQVERVIRYIQYLKEKYNVGFISFGDEDFGATKKWIEEFIKKIKPLDILYRISGACVNNIDPFLLKRLRDSGCVSIHYGFESGSDRILKVMEKRVTVELNTKVAMWTNEANLQTVYALVVGMPGESYDTIRETTNFVKKVTEFLSREPILSINALVVLPGAPVYEYARHKGLLGKTLEDEEDYLLRVSNQGGSSLRQLNLTDYPYFIVQGWIRCIYLAARYNYYRKNNSHRISASKLFSEILRILNKRRFKNRTFLGEFFNHPVFYYSRYFISPVFIMYKNFKEDNIFFLQRFFELLVWPFKRKTFTNYVSLRSFLDEKTQNINSENIQLLRLGR